MTNEEFLNGLKVINDSTRLSIIKMLSKNGKMCACKILEDLDITQGTLSHHMKVMVEAGFVTCERVGKWCHYSLNRSKLNEIVIFISAFAEPCNINKSCTCK